MQSRYVDQDAERFVAQMAPLCPAALADSASQRDLALRVYTSRLLGQEPSLVLHGGGNTSVKASARDISGGLHACLCVKGSGWDLASIEPAGFPLCKLEPLLKLCQLSELSDENMVKALRSQMLDPMSPTPSVEALLHAFLPAKFVDHTHADAILALVDQPDARQHVERVWGSKALFVPYIMPGFVLLRRIVELTRTEAPGLPLILEKHGIFTFGETAKQSYELMIAAVTQAEDYLNRRGAPLGQVEVRGRPALPEAERGRLQQRLTPIVRGALARAAQGKRFIATWQDDPLTLSLASHPQVSTLTQRGPLTPDHVIRTKQRPLLLPESRAAENAELGALLDTYLERYNSEYNAYFERGCQRTGLELTRLDPLPRVLLVPELGALCVGPTRKAAQIVADIYGHTSKVMLCASALGQYQPVTESQLFEVEYWSLEQAKLGKASGSAEFAGRIALVTGAARGIGLQTASELLARGAHVMLSDRDSETLEASARALSQSFGSAVAFRAADVCDPDQVTQLMAHVVSSFGGLDIVVSNAGSAPAGLLHETAGDQALRASLEVNLLGHQNVARAASELLIRQAAGGVLLFNASKSAFNPGPEFGPYAVAKAALVALMKQYAIDLSKHGIRAAAVNADRVRTDLFGGGVLEARAKARGISPAEYFKLNLLSRETTAQDVAAAFCFLANASATTGAVIPVDGGNPAAFPR